MSKTNMQRIWWILPLSLVIALLSCNGCSEKKSAAEMDPAAIQDQLIKQNQEKHKQETARIDAFIKDKNWPMQSTGTGLRYWIYESGVGPMAKTDDVAVLSYTVSMMDGKELYKAMPAEPGKFLIGQDNVESGLHEAMLLLHVGDKAKLILPSHLAFGFTGDSGKIPQDATLVYDVYLMNVE